MVKITIEQVEQYLLQKIYNTQNLTNLFVKRHLTVPNKKFTVSARFFFTTNRFPQLSQLKIVTYRHVQFFNGAYSYHDKSLL